ncbi:c-type cytochrome [Niveispirillum sp. KHB5.9]|uniref:c-type cytochrome n=1 Tax=Niveispirillum sp. KHB5.9 TaxID=3400269 RepID=UPI003A8515F1
MRTRFNPGRLLRPALALSLLLAAAIDAPARDTARGAYLVGIMGCGDCHTAGTMQGKPDMARPLGGSDVGWQVPGMGVFVGSNLTPDRETGLGAWSDAEIVTALRTGVRPDGRQLAPVMPYMGYKNMTDADADAIVAYLRSLKPVSTKVPGPFGPTEKPTLPYFTLVMPGK